MLEIWSPAAWRVSRDGHIPAPSFAKPRIREATDCSDRRSARWSIGMNIYHRILDRLFGSYAFRQHFEERVDAIHRGQAVPCPAFPCLSPNPYGSKLPAGDGAGMAPAGNGHRGLFITARFRSGSTLLWHLYANLPGVTAYYEPLHEAR